MDLKYLEFISPELIFLNINHVITSIFFKEWGRVKKKSNHCQHGCRWCNGVKSSIKIIQFWFIRTLMNLFGVVFFKRTKHHKQLNVKKEKRRKKKRKNRSKIIHGHYLPLFLWYEIYKFTSAQRVAKFDSSWINKKWNNRLLRFVNTMYLLIISYRPCSSFKIS